MFAGDGVLDAGFQNLAAINDCPDFGNGAERSVLLEGTPIAVEGDQAGFVLRHILAQDAFHAHGQGLEHLALFHHGDPLEGVDVIGMHREEPDKLVHALIEPAVVFGKRHQVVADLGLLLGGLLEQALGHDEFHVAAGDKDLLEAVLHPADAVGDKSEARAVENGFLDTGHEAEAQVLADLADLAEEVEVEDQLLVLAGAQVVEQLVDHQQQAVLREHLAELGHHVFEGPLVAGDGPRLGEHILHTEFFEMLFQFGHQDVAQGHGGGSDFGTDNLETSGDLRGCVADTIVLQPFQQGGICGKAGDHRHQVRLTGAVVTDDQQAFVVDRLVELHLRNDKLGEPFGHFLGNDIGVHEGVCGARFVRVTQLNDRLNRVELDKVSVFHACPASLLFFAESTVAVPSMPTISASTES